MRNRSIRMILAVMGIVILLTGCRARTTDRDGADAGSGSGSGPETNGAVSDRNSIMETGDAPDESQAENGGEITGRTKENPDAPRKEYDESAPAEILPALERLIHDTGEGNGSPTANEEAGVAATQINDAAEDEALQTVHAEQAEQTGVSEDAKEADSAMTYYSVLLQERTGSLFECKRLNAYWETAEDHRTIHKSSTEHEMILNAGVYDVSARLLEENLRVDDGWIGRKNPGVVIKMVDSSVLGTGTQSDASARKVYANLISREGWKAMDAVRYNRVVLLSMELLQAEHLRLFAALAVAKTAYPDLLDDVDLDEALDMLVQEAAGSSPGGIFYYTGGT